MKKSYALLFLLILACNLSYCQTASDFSFFTGTKQSVETTPRSSTVQPDKNEINVSVDILYRFYKSNLSTQDGSRCSFYPSCADYCQQAIHKNGLIMGGVQALDRLTRCNGLSPHKYEIDMRRRKLIDHVH